MRALAHPAPRVVPGRAVDILEHLPADGMCRGYARVDLHDPVFFDHALDHVPGMLLIAAGLEMAEYASMLAPDGVRLRLSFNRFCELGPGIEVSAARELGGTSSL